MMGSFFVSNYFPLMGWVDVVTGMSARVEKNFKELDLFYQEFIDDHLNPKRTEFMQEDILGTLLQLRKDQFSLIDMTLNHIKAVLMMIELAFANLLYSFDWELPVGMTIEDIDTNIKPGLTRHKRNALCLMPKNYSV
ncbi:hypothetical protein ACSBR2_037134 [Camellia fascicularis]